jgi:hypothetical protein
MELSREWWLAQHVTATFLVFFGQVFGRVQGFVYLAARLSLLQAESLV